MSWLQRLIETYDACFGQPQFDDAPLTPIDHVEQQAHIEIALDGAGNFLRAAVVNKEPTLIPATEKSAGRTSGSVAHPLCDKLRYVADLDDPADHKLYLQQLQRWAVETPNVRVHAILAYVERGTVVEDLTGAEVLTKTAAGHLEKEWKNGFSSLARLLSPESKTKYRYQGDALIRWRVELDDYESAVWKDQGLRDDWIAFNATQPSIEGLCFASGKIEALAVNHPKFLRRGGDQAKLISANDSPYDNEGKPKQHGFTFVGRFQNTSEAYGLGSAATQKAHNALRWLIMRQGAPKGKETQVVVAWAVHGERAPTVVSDGWDFLNAIEDVERADPERTQPARYTGDAGQDYARRLAKAVRGYGSRFDDHTRIVVMVLDSATKGRLAVLFYRELPGSEFLMRLERWHREMAWPQSFGKVRHFLGAPAPRDIARAAFGKERGDHYQVDERMLQSTVDRLLPCIVDGTRFPRDLTRTVTAQTIRLGSFGKLGSSRYEEFERSLGIACALIKCSLRKEDQRMALDEDRTTRSYLYGRLLAVAETIERRALRLSKDERETAANRYFQTFADRPFETWKTVSNCLKPYEAKLRSSGKKQVAFLTYMDNLRNEIGAKFNTLDFSLPRTRIDAEFLLGYYCQRAALKGGQEITDEAEPEGDSE